MSERKKALEEACFRMGFISFGERTEDELIKSQLASH